jgi:hypothetical protein
MRFAIGYELGDGDDTGHCMQTHRDARAANSRASLLAAGASGLRVRARRQQRDLQ